MWKRGRRLFSTAAVLMVLTSLAHTAGNLAPHAEDPAEKRLFSEMSSFRVPLGMGMSPSVEDIYWDLVFTMSITFAALGVLNLLIAASEDATDRLLRRVALFNAIWVGAFLLLSWRYQIPPALISAAVIEAVTIASLLTARGSLSKDNR